MFSRRLIARTSGCSIPVTGRGASELARAADGYWEIAVCGVFDPDVTDASRLRLATSF